MSLPYLTNHIVKVPGTTVTAYLAEWTREGSKGKWTYTLWTKGEWVEHGDDLIAVGTLDFSPEALGYGVHTENWTEEHFIKVTPEQVARIAFLLEVEYAS